MCMTHPQICLLASESNAMGRQEGRSYTQSRRQGLLKADRNPADVPRKKQYSLKQGLVILSTSEKYDQPFAVKAQWLFCSSVSMYLINKVYFLYNQFRSRTFNYFWHWPTGIKLRIAKVHNIIINIPVITNYNFCFVCWPSFCLSCITSLVEERALEGQGWPYLKLFWNKISVIHFAGFIIPKWSDCWVH